MTKNLISKIVSAILVMAICLTTVFGCLITVNAADQTGTYTITSDEVPSGARTATTYVTLTSGSDAGFSSGTFDLMFHNDLLDKDENGNVYEDGTTVLPADTDENGMISAYNVYKLDADGDIMLDEKGNKIVEKVIKENATNSGTRLPNAYDEKYVDTNDDGVNDSIVSNLYDTKIEIYSATATDGTVLDVATAFTAPADDTTGFSTAGDRSYDYVLLDEYKSYEASETQLNKYSRSYSHIDVVTSNLSYDISTVSEDSTGLMGRYAQYAQGFKNVSFDAGDNTCKSITFKVTFDFLGRTDRMSANSVAPTQEELENSTDKRADGRYCGDNQVQLGLNYILTLTPDSESDIAEFEDTNNDYRKSNFHIHFYYTTSRETDIISSGKDYTVYQGYCGNCLNTASTYKAPMIADKFVAERLEESAKIEKNNGVGNYYFHNYKNIYGFNVVYEDDGTLSVNIHFDQYTSGDTFIIGLSDGTKIAKYEDTLNATTPATSFFATVEHWVTDDPSDIIRDVRPLKTSGKMVTIKGLSAKDIDTKFYIARMGNDGTGVDQIGRTHVFSLADYCMKVINEEDVYYVEDIIESDDTVDGIVNNTAASKEEMKAKDKNIAAALINYGEAAKNALAQSYDGSATGRTIYWDGKTYTKPETTDSDGNILINTAAELAYIALKAKLDETNGESYKIADGISNIILQPEGVVDTNKITSLSNSAKVKEYLKNLSGAVEWEPNTSAVFNGNFDGNGATIYGIYQESLYCGLFPFVDGGIAGKDGTNSANVGFDYTGNTIKNISVRNSYMNSGWRVGVIVGYCIANNAGAKVNGTINVSGCTVANCYIENSDKDNANKGLFIGANTSEIYHISNCIVYGNYAIATVRNKLADGTLVETGAQQNIYFVGGTAQSFVNMENDKDGRIYSTIENTIILDTPLHNGSVNYAANTKYNFEKVYTNTAFALSSTNSNFVYAETDIASVTTEGAQGSAAATNMPNLDWSKWAYGMSGEYPTPTTSDSTTETTGETWYWGGNTDATLADNGEAGDSWDTAIIIDSADELAYICTKINPTASCNKYYKIKDGVDSIVLQASTYGDAIKSLESADRVQDYFENIIGESNRLNWMKNKGGVFNGNFDGNGATVYGLFAQATSNAYYCGLFQGVDGGSLGDFTDSNGDGICGGSGEVNNDADGKELSAVIDNDGIIIKNITVKNSYFDASTSDNGNRRVGAIVAECYSPNWGAHCAGTVNIDSCGVINCYLNTNTTNISSGGVMFGNSTNEVAKINNVLVCGNNAYNTAKEIHDGIIGFELPVVGGVPGSDATTGRINAMTNSLILGTTPYHQHNFSYATYHNNKYFDNVYTDKDVPGVNYYYSSSNGWVKISNVTHSGLSQVNLADMIGSKAADVVKAINDANGDSRDMYVGNAWGYPGFEKAGVMPTANQMAFDGLTMTNYDDYLVNEATNPNCYMYATSLNLKANPYIAFTFAFQNEYRDAANKANVNVTLTTADGTEYTTTADQMTNNAGAGRYHLYRFTDVPVEYLCEDISVKVEYNGTTTELGTFSVEGFALDIQNVYKKDPCQYYATRVEAAKALLYYSQMINARYGSIA